MSPAQISVQTVLLTNPLSFLLGEENQMGKLMPGQDGCVCKRAFAGAGSSKLCQVCMAPILVTPADTRYSACACVHLACACACGAGTCGCPHGSYPAKCLIGICGHLAQQRWLSHLCRAYAGPGEPPKNPDRGQKEGGKSCCCGLAASLDLWLGGSVPT